MRIWSAILIRLGIHRNTFFLSELEDVNSTEYQMDVIKLDLIDVDLFYTLEVPNFSEEVYEHSEKHALPTC